MNVANLFWLLALAALWGPSFLFIKVAVNEIPPLTLAAVRVSMAAIILYIVLKIQKRSLPKWGDIWRHFIFMGFFAHALPFALFNWGEIYIDSALAAILNGTVPLFTIVLAHFFTTDDRMTPTKFFGTAIGFMGLILLVLPTLIGGVKGTAMGVFAVTTAAASYGVAIVYAGNHLRGLPPLVAPTAQLTMASVYLIIVSFLFETPLELINVSWQAFGSVSILAIFGTALAFVIYYKILESSSASRLSMVTYLVPVFGIALGVMILKETLTWNVYAGCFLILLGVMVVNGVLQLFRSTLRKL